MRHEIEKPSNWFEVFRGPTTEEDVMVDVTFHNPYPVSEGEWNYDFLLRSSRPNVYDWFYIRSDGRWVREIRFGEAGDEQYTLPFGDSTISNVDLTPGGKNSIRMVLIGYRAWVFINGAFHQETDLSWITDVAPISLIVNDHREDDRGMYFILRLTQLIVRLDSRLGRAQIQNRPQMLTTGPIRSFRRRRESRV